MGKFNIKINLADQLPENFSLSYKIFEEMVLGSFKITDSPEKQAFPYNNKTAEWRVEIIYDDYKSVAGKIYIPTLKGEAITSKKMGTVKEMDVNFIYSKLPVRDETRPSRWSTSFGDQISKKIEDSINRIISKDLRDEVMEKIRQYKEFLRIKNQ